MINKENVKNKVEDTFKVLEAIEKVDVNHFFKHKVLQKIQAEKDVRSPVFSWFTPQFQLAALGLILLLNTSAIFYAYDSVKETDTTVTIEIFAKEYSLQSVNNSILN